MFIPGETIVHKFHMPFDTTKVAKVIATYRQNGHVILEREPDEISPDDGRTQVIINFTQKESLLFADTTSFLVQLNVILIDGTRCTSKEMLGYNGRQHIREEVNSNA